MLSDLFTFDAVSLIESGIIFRITNLLTYILPVVLPYRKLEYLCFIVQVKPVSLTNIWLLLPFLVLIWEHG